MYTYVDWYAFKLWGSVTLVAVVLIGLLIWCWCCRCCCDSCCCWGRDCDYDCHCRCCFRGCSRVKKENVTQASRNKSLELGESARGVDRFGVATVGTVTVDEQVDLHSSTKGEPIECSFSYEDETNDGRVSVVPVQPRNDHDEEGPDDVTSGVKDGEQQITFGRDNKGYEADDDDDDDDDDHLHRPGFSPTSDIDASDRNKSDIDNDEYVDGYNSWDDSDSSICCGVEGQHFSFAHEVVKTNGRFEPAVAIALIKCDRLQDQDSLDDEHTKDNDDRNLNATEIIGHDDKCSSFETFGDMLRQLDLSHSDDVDRFMRYIADRYNSEGELNESSSSSSSSSSDEEEVCGFMVGNKLMERHVVMRRDMPATMSTTEKETFAYQKARGLYNCSIPWKYTLIMVDNKKHFRRKILKEAIQKAVGLDHFTTTESFDIVDFKRVSRIEYEYEREEQARLVLSCNPEQVVSHLAGVKCSRYV